MINVHGRNEFQIGAAVPNSYFGNNAINKFYLEGMGRSGCASTGFSLGYKYLYSFIKNEDLYATISLHALYNDLNNELKDWYEDILEVYDYKYRIPKYFNIPLMLGLQYEKSLSISLKWYGEVGAGMNMLYISKFGYDYGQDNSHWQYFKPSFTVAYKVGTGVLVKDKYTIGISYLGLGTHKVKFVEEIKGDSLHNEIRRRTEYTKKLKVSDYSVSIGVRF